MCKSELQIVIAEQIGWAVIISPPGSGENGTLSLNVPFSAMLAPAAQRASELPLLAFLISNAKSQPCINPPQSLRGKQVFLL